MTDLRTALRRLNDAANDVRDALRLAAVEKDILRAFAAHVEQATATGDGLSPDDTVALHLMARDVLKEQKP